jgi:hypothetical protein
MGALVFGSWPPGLFFRLMIWFFWPDDLFLPPKKAILAKEPKI